MQPETFILWTFAGCLVCILVIAVVVDTYEHWNKCRHKWTAWSTPEKPEPNYYKPTYPYQTRCCINCNQFEKRDIT